MLLSVSVFGFTSMVIEISDYAPLDKRSADPGVENGILLLSLRGWGSYNSLEAQNRIEQPRLVMEDLTGH